MKGRLESAFTFVKNYLPETPVEPEESATMEISTSRVKKVQLGIRVEIFTVLWMIVEVAVSIGAGLAAHSVLLIAFGIDNIIELGSGGILL